MSKISLATFLFLLASRLVDAQLVYPTCPTTWSWSFNSFGQSPCAIAAYLQGACNHGVFTIPTLDSGNSYTGPTGPGDASDLCKCNTVVYSLMSACDACQGAKWFPWSSWTQNCTAIDPLTTFSNIIPTETSVPEWAFLNITTEGTWDPVLAYQVGDNIEVIGGQPGTLAVVPAPTTTQTVVPGLSPTQLPSSNGGSSNDSSSNKGKMIGAIIGGVLGGLLFIAGSVGLWLWMARVRRRKATRAAAAVIFGDHRALPLSPMQEKKKGNDDDLRPPFDIARDVI